MEVKAGRRLRLPERSALFVLAFSLLITVAAWQTVDAVAVNEQHRLLQVQAAQAADLITVAVNAVESPLETALQVAIATQASPAGLANFESSNVGAGKTFAYFAVLVDQKVVVHAGTAPLVDPSSAPGRALAGRAMSGRTLAVTGLGQLQGFGYARAESAGGHIYLVYAERLLGPSRVTTTEQDPAFSDLRFATYLGATTSTSDLTTTDVPLDQLPIRGYTVRKVIPFGDTQVTLVTAARGPLGGQLLAHLGLVFLGGGLLLTLIATTVTDVLVRRRRAAERSQAEITELYRQLDERYDAQRAVAETLQHALLPETDPQLPGLATAARYMAGTAGVDIGGDWYGLALLGEDRFAFVVGDVSGRGVEAAAIMARLRFTLLAYLVEGHPPDVALAMTGDHIDIETDGHFATALAGVGRVGRRSVVMASAGHLSPILVRGGEARTVDIPCGPPLGTVPGARYPAEEVRFEPGDELLAFTDGLVERRDSSLDEGLARLRRAARAEAPSLDEKVARLVREMAGDGTEDDIAVLAIAWPAEPAP